MRRQRDEEEQNRAGKEEEKWKGDADKETEEKQRRPALTLEPLASLASYFPGALTASCELAEG
jgi:hypothetical protein